MPVSIDKPVHKTHTFEDCGTAPAELACFEDAYGVGMKTLHACSREVAMIGLGTASGLVNEIKKDPLNAVVRGCGSMALGTVLGAAAVAESPVIAGAAVATGLALTGKWAWDTLNPYDAVNLGRYAKIGNALETTWYNSDKKSFENSVRNMQDGAGPIALDLGLMALGGKSAEFGARFLPRLQTELGIPNSTFAFATEQTSLGRFNPFEDHVLFARKHGKCQKYIMSNDRIDAMTAKEWAQPPKQQPDKLQNLFAPPDRKQHVDIRPSYFSGRYGLFFR